MSSPPESAVVAKLPPKASNDPTTQTNRNIIIGILALAGVGIVVGVVLMIVYLPGASVAVPNADNSRGTRWPTSPAAVASDPGPRSAPVAQGEPGRLATAIASEARHLAGIAQLHPPEEVF